MADGTKIEWTDATINPIRARRVVRAADGSVAETRQGWHCEHVSEACRNCYAEAINRDRFGTGLDYKPGHLGSRGGEVEIVFVDKAIRDMLRWRRPRRIFVCSMTDLFADFVPDWMIDRVFAAAALAPQHTIQILTKRPERMREYLRDPSRPHRIAGELLAWADRWGMTGSQILISLGRRAREEDPEHVPLPLPNVWLGVTAERQQEADERRPHLAALAGMGWATFVSQEPALGLIDWAGWEFLEQMISGGESGPKARPAHPDWFRTSRDWCASTGVAYFHKQNGEFSVAVDRGRDDPDWRLDYSREFDDRHPYKWLNLAGGCGFHGGRFHVMHRVGKSRAGRLLDGVEHNAFPEG